MFLRRWGAAAYGSPALSLRKRGLNLLLGYLAVLTVVLLKEAIKSTHPCFVPGCARKSSFINCSILWLAVAVTA